VTDFEKTPPEDPLHRTLWAQGWNQEEREAIIRFAVGRGDPVSLGAACMPAIPRCDICGDWAFYAYLDTRETKPDGEWRTWEPGGPQKVRCSKHQYVPKVTYLDGHTSGGYNV